MTSLTLPRQLCQFFSLAVMVAMSPYASATEFVGRGVFNFASGSGCPLSGSTLTGTHCNRLALDDTNTRAVLNTTAKTIRISNTQNYSDKKVVADVMLQGNGLAADGRRVPLSLHLKLSRKKTKWKVSMHAHVPVPGEFTDIKIDPYIVTVNEPTGDETVLSPAQSAKVLAKPSLAARVAREFVQVRSNVKHAGDADITIALGLDKAAKSVARARFQSDQASTKDLLRLLKNGTWSLEIEALTGQIPHRVVQRELFLYKLDNEKLLRPLVEKGFNKHDKLIMGAKDGKGYLRYNSVQEDFPGASNTARIFMEDSFIGLILSWQQSQHVNKNK